jgi:hypothetical protein
VLLMGMRHRQTRRSTPGVGLSPTTRVYSGEDLAGVADRVRRVLVRTMANSASENGIRVVAQQRWSSDPRTMCWSVDMMAGEARRSGRVFRAGLPWESPAGWLVQTLVTTCAAARVQAGCFRFDGL